MTIKDTAEKVQSVIKTGDALGKSEAEIEADVEAVIKGMSAADVEAVSAHIAASVEN